MPPFEFATAGRIIYGRDKALDAAEMIFEQFGNCWAGPTLLITGKSPARFQTLIERFTDAGIAFVQVESSGEPTVDDIRTSVARARESQCGSVIAIGGGSVIDAGKAVAALLANDGDPLDYLEVIGAGKAIRKPSVPFLAMPTTAGTGAEVTRNAVLSSPEHQVKVSLRSPMLLPAMAIVDPALTDTLPPEVTASTGLDALTQLIEAFVSNRSQPMTDALCREGLVRAARSLLIAFQDGRNIAARDDMAIASLFSGLALANAGLGAVHGFAGPLGGMFQVPHGMICGILLPHVVRVNLEVLLAERENQQALAKFEELARILTARQEALCEDLLRWIEALCEALSLPRLSELGISRQDVPEAAAKAAKASSMKGNPIPLSREQLCTILESAL